MRLRGKILIVLSITLALLVAGLYGLATNTIMEGFVELEADSMRLDVRRVRDALAGDVMGLTEKTGDWAYWDDLYTFIEKPNDRFIESAVSPAALSSMRIDALIVVDNEGRPVIARGFDREKQVITLPTPGLLDLLKPGAVLNPLPGQVELTRPAEPGKSATVDGDRLVMLDPPTCPNATLAGLVKIEHTFYLVATRPVLHSDQSGPTLGRIAFARAFDGAALEELAARTHVKITTSPCAMGPVEHPKSAANAPAPKPIPHTPSTQPGVAEPPIFTLPGPTPDPDRTQLLREAPTRTLLVTPIDSQTIIGETVVQDITNQPAFVLRVEAFRNIVNRGKRSLDFLTLCIVTSGLAFGLVTYLALDRLVLSRVFHLSDDIQSIGKTGASTGRVRQDGHDELASLAGAINNALAAIDSSQQLLRQREAESRKLALVAARTDNTVVITDPQGRIEWVNEGFTRQCGYTLAEVIGKKPGAFLQGPDTDPNTVAHIRQQLLQGRGFHVEILNYTKNGTPYWADIEVQPIYDEAGTLVNFMAIESDITQGRRLTQELRNARDAAEAANRAKSQFLANMSHEIRTPMTAILGFAELLRDAQTSPSQRDNYAHAVIRNGHHLLAIINDILDLSKIEAEKMTIEQLATSVPQILAEVISMTQQAASEKNLPLTVRYDTPVPTTITTDPYRLRQIITNLVSNAVKFTHEGSVTIAVAMLDGFDAAAPRIRFDVIDTGAGIADEQLKGLFRPFTQADTSTTRRFGGTGLGLTISRRLAQLLGGDITIESKEGAGSTFSLTVPTGQLAGVTALTDPAAEQAAQAQPARTDDRSAPAQQTPASRDKIARPLEGATILLAEDGIDNQRLISFLLTQAGAKVLLAATGQAAVDQMSALLAAGSAPDIILMDMQMPELDGYAATRVLRKKGVTTVIIALTAHAMASDREKCILAGCDDYVSKPINRERMIKLLSDHVAHIRAKK